jgi:hypothetical protein
MADSKISALPASTTPLAGTEVLPIVQGGATRQVSVANLTAGRAISATQLTLTTGSVIVASGQGIDFSATSHPAGMTSELFDDYEEGTWTPSLGGNTTYLLQSGTYVKIGRQVTAYFMVRVNVIGTGSATEISGLPFASAADNLRGMGAITYFDTISTNNTWICPYVGSSGSTISFLGQNAADTNANDGISVFVNSTFVLGAVQYVV